MDDFTRMLQKIASQPGSIIGHADSHEFFRLEPADSNGGYEVNKAALLDMAKQEVGDTPTVE